MFKPLLVSVLLFSASPFLNASSLDFDTQKKQAYASKYQQQIKKIDSLSEPHDLIKSLSSVVFEAVTDAKQQANEESVNAHMSLIVRELLLPFADIRFAAYKILGPQLRSSSKDERDMFVEAMKKNLVATYSSALVQYNGQEIRYAPTRLTSGQKMVAVRTELVDSKAKPISMTFKLRKNGKTGEWKAYDLVVEGISLIDSKRSELSRPLRNDGIEEVATAILAN